MADIAPSSGSYVKPYRSPWGAFPIRTMAVSSGVSSLVIRVGDRVGLDVRTDTNYHRIKQSTALSTVVVGFAAEEASTNPDKSTGAPVYTIPVWEAHPAVEFQCITKGGTLASSLVGARKSIKRDSTLNIWYIDIADDTEVNKNVVVTELIDAVGDSGGLVAFRHIERVSSASTNTFLAFYK